jgi:lysyl-tRNA synthetase class 2
MSWRRLQDWKLQERLKIRSFILARVREFFVREGFLEVETPILVPVAGQEPYLNPLKTEVWDARGRRKKAYLITSPEYAHKKLLAAGFSKIFEITKAFRAGEPWSGLHNLEFTILEWYHTGIDYQELMRQVESMISYVVSSLRDFLLKHPKSSFPSTIISQKGKSSRFQRTKISYQGREIDLTPPWERISMAEAWQRFAGVKEETKIYDKKSLLRLCQERGYSGDKTDSYDDLFFKIFLTEIEPKLGWQKPAIIYDYPAQLAALARLKKNNRHWAERFEVYIAGIELANGFSELNDKEEQKKRFIKEQKLRKKLGKEIIPLDEDFLEALAHMPSAAGVALGLDRLVMLLTNAPTIEDVLAFPAKEIF